MMQSNIMFWLLICGHLIGDFYLQPQKLVDRKKIQQSFLWLHGGIYGLAVLILLLPIMSRQTFWAFEWIVTSHLIIDFVKVRLIKGAKEDNYFKNNIFLIDQLAHIAIIFIVAYICATSYTIALSGFGNMLLNIYGNLQIRFIPMDFLRIITVFLLIGKPANIIIKEINRKENLKESNETDNETTTDTEQNSSEYQNAGRIIGTLERALIVILVILKQYAAIGFVMTAKSITRYDKITKDPAFAEYYLVGTLLSVLIAMLSVLLIQPI